MRRALPVLFALAAVSCVPSTRTSRPSIPEGNDRTVRVSAAQFGSQVQVHVGDILVVQRPADFDEWDLAFSTDVLRSLNTDAGRRRPPADGWTFAVVARGTTDIALTPFIARGGAPNVPKFVVTITAE